VVAEDCHRVRSEASAPSSKVLPPKVLELRDKMCACKDAACGIAVREKFDKLVSEIGSSGEELTKVIGDIEACSAKLTTRP
jgi:hypothetical protein